MVRKHQFQNFNSFIEDFFENTDAEMLDTKTDRKNADADRNIPGQKMNSFMKDYFITTDQNDLRDIFGELGTVAE